MTDQRKTDPSWFDKRDQLRFRACNGDTHALMFLSSIMDAVEVWDDLIDRDNPVSDEKLTQTFLNLIFWLPQNPFFEAHKNYLLPIIMTCVNAWLDSNKLSESKVQRDRQAAWWLKQMGVELYGAVAFLMGGFDHMRSVSLEARTVLAHEDFTDYEQEHQHA